MALFCDASCLIKFTRKQGAHIVRYTPPYYDFNGQIEFITSCAFPELYDQADSIFVSSIARANCFTWSFISNLEQYSVVLISHHILGDAFLKFLQDARTCLKDKNPIEIFDQIWNYVTSWTYNSKTSILTVITPALNFDSLQIGSKLKSSSSLILSSQKKQKGIFEVKLDNSIVVYSDYDPSYWLGSDNIDYLKIWHALMTGKCILIINDDPSSVSNAVFSIISLAAPFLYCEEYLAFTRLGDPRFAQIIEGSTRWKIVGTTNHLAAERCNQFSVVINLSKRPSLSQISSSVLTSPNQLPLRSPSALFRPTLSLSSLFNRSFSKTSNNEQSSLKRLTVKLMQKLEDVFNDILSINPYSDFLQIPLSREDVSPYFHHHTSVTFDNTSLTRSSSKSNSTNFINDDENDTNSNLIDDDSSNTDNANDNNNGDNNDTDPNKKKKVQKQLSIAEVLDFSQTQTFRTWRYNIACRSAFRDAMLSELPKDTIDWCNIDDLRCLLNVIPFIREKYERDAHMCAVLHRHEKLANKRLKSLAKIDTEAANSNTDQTKE